MLQLTQTYLVWWVLFEGGKELWQTVLLSRRKDSNYAEARCQLFHSFVCLFMCVCYSTSPTRPHQWLLHGDGSILMFVWGQSEALFYFVVGHPCEKPKARSVSCHKTYCYRIFFHHLLLWSHLPLFNLTLVFCFFFGSFFLVNFCFWGIAQVAQVVVFFSFVLNCKVVTRFHALQIFWNICLGRRNGWKQQF